MTNSLFKYKFKVMSDNHPHFTYKQDCLGTWGFFGTLKVMAPISFLTTTGAADDTNEYLHFVESV